mmetsp:Transcript_2378/g.7343  ORF Transcript_2378/g.7343 Transcript_2378/m.7343 type:complete len:208 (+) Transcript_2378:1765-2388(+)
MGRTHPPRRLLAHGQPQGVLDQPPPTRPRPRGQARRPRDRQPSRERPRLRSPRRSTRARSRSRFQSFAGLRAPRLDRRRPRRTRRAIPSRAPRRRNPPPHGQAAPSNYRLARHHQPNCRQPAALAPRLGPRPFERRRPRARPLEGQGQGPGAEEAGALGLTLHSWETSSAATAGHSLSTALETTLLSPGEKAAEHPHRCSTWTGPPL